MSESDNNIDHLLTGQNAEVKEQIPEDKSQVQESSEITQNDDYDIGDDNVGEHSEQEKEEVQNKEDDYGNEPEPEKRYTESEVNERINQAVRERLARLERNVQPENAQVQKQAKDGFEYDPNNEESWQKQLESFVEQTVTKMSHKQIEQSRMAQEQQAQADFEMKFQSGMKRFKDFQEVVAPMPFTDAMTLAARGISDPSAFIYAAAKKAPDEIKRIAAIPDQYAQMVEIGKLEERLRKNRTSTNAPRPLAKQKEDVTSKPEKAKREESIEDRIQEVERKKLAQLNSRFRR